MNKIAQHACLPVLTIVMLLSPLAGCSKKSEPPASELSQQQPLKQRVEELLKRAETGDADAQAELGQLYASGQGLPKNAAHAAELFRKAADKGIASAQYGLGKLYEQGDGVPQDSAKAVDLLKRSAVNGYAKGQAALGALYAKGKGVTHDEVLAYVWSSLAVAQGEAEAKQVQDSVALSSVLRDEAERLKTKWKRGVEIVREKQEAAVPVK
jgi:hypothetical protein